MLTNGLTDVDLASLFSLHRPISVSTPIPTPVTAKQFAEIFAVRKTSKPKPNQVIQTISATVQSIDQATARAEQRQRSPSSSSGSSNVDIKAAAAAILNGNAGGIHHLDGQPSFNLDELARKLQYFSPPPPPMPMPNSASTTVHLGEHPSASIDLPAAQNDGASVDEIPAGRSHQPFLERMRQRQEAWERSRGERPGQVTWRALSVRRQRKLKMKKHKYKKLMRRQRNLRRKQDRL